MPPVLSICIPTYNRADLLDYSLGNLRALERFNLPLEVIVSDNASTDATPQVVAARRAEMPYVRYCRQQKNVGPVGNWLNSIRNATGEFVVYMSDDDSIIPENLVAHVDRLQRSPQCVAVYCDWIAYDDDAQQELHRYYHIRQPAMFAPSDPLGLVNFVVGNQIYPEMHICRREPFLRAILDVKYGRIPFHPWMYRMSRQGVILFDLLPYYREHRTLKPQFQRTHWSNMDGALDYIGDPMRCGLETIFLWAHQDAGCPQLSQQQALQVRAMIDRFLLNRTPLEVSRAAGRKDWIFACELKRRLTLWGGPCSTEDMTRDLLGLSFPAALQSVYDMYCKLSDVSGLCPLGFQRREIQTFFQTHYPDVRLLEPDAPPPAEGYPLVLQREATENVPPPETLPGYRLYLDRLLDNYRVHPMRLDVTQL